MNLKTRLSKAKPLRIFCVKVLSVPLALPFFLISNLSYGASCCGGGASSGVILPKFNQSMWDIGLATESDQGEWRENGTHQKTLAGSEFNQQRINLNYAQRLSDNWQINFSLPLVNNLSESSGKEHNNFGAGDLQISTWYEAFENVTCVYKITNLESLKPSIYFGANLILPTGTSAYSDDANEHNVHGLGFYRLDASMIIEKTVYPFSLSYQASYGEHFERPISQQSGQAITPYDLKLGARTNQSLTLGYTIFLPTLSMLTFSSSVSEVVQAKNKADGVTDETTGFDKKSLGLSLGYLTPARDWTFKLSSSYAFGGNNTTKTYLTSLGVSRVY